MIVAYLQLYIPCFNFFYLGTYRSKMEKSNRVLGSVADYSIIAHINNGKKIIKNLLIDSRTVCLTAYSYVLFWFLVKIQSTQNRKGVSGSISNV